MVQAKWLMALITVFCFTTVPAQDRPDRYQKNTVMQQQGSSNDGANADRNNQPQGNATDTIGAATPAGESNATNAKQSGNTTQASGLMEHTSSPSGSPSILSDDSGAKRDGTNNVQRATMNMVGSPAQHISLSKDVVNVSQQVRKERKSVSDASSRRESNQINNKTRRENNDLSDQNLSSKNQGTKIIQENSRKKNRGKHKKG